MIENENKEAIQNSLNHISDINDLETLVGYGTLQNIHIYMYIFLFSK